MKPKDTLRKRTSLTAEIIGPSGAGKSTLCSLLNESNQQIKAGITIWGLARRHLVTGAFVALPTVAQMVFAERELNIESGKQIVRLQAFYRHLNAEHLKKNRHSDKTNDVLILDEGVVFALSKLRADRQNCDQFMERWEKKTLDRWSKMLDTVIWLDASNDVLIERIRTREKHHRMKHRPDDEIREFLGRYREAYNNVVASLQSRNGLRVLKFDTEKTSLENIADELIGSVGNK